MRDDWDIFDNEIQKAMIRARRISQEYVKPYIKQLTIYERALELACEKYIGVDGISYVLRDNEDYFDKSDEQIQKETIEYFLDKAKKELEEQECVK